MALLDDIKVYPLGNMESPYREDKWCYAVELPHGKTHAETRNLLDLAANFRFGDQLAGIIVDFNVATGGNYSIMISNGHILLTDAFNFKSPFNVFEPQDEKTAMHVVTAFYVAADRIKDRLLEYASTHTIVHKTAKIDIYEPERRQAHV